MRISLLCFLVLCSSLVLAQKQLGNYINKGLNSNIALQQLDFQLDAAMYALAEAKANRSVRVDFVPQYTLAAGGRTIDIPVGDLLNPVYSTLNELTTSNAFPQINNVNELLNPNNFYDVKIRASYPIINSSIGINVDIKTLEKDLAEYDIQIYRSALREQIAIAYFDVLSANKAVAIYQNAKLLILESLRVNKSLYKNNKVNGTAVARNEQDLMNIETEISNAQKLVQNASAYLNFLINAPLDSPVMIDSISTLPPMELLQEATVSNREELLKLNSAVQLNQKLVELAETYRKPELNAFLDMGIQNFDFALNSNSPYVLGGLSMRINLYDGGQGREKIKREKSIVETRVRERNNTKSQLELSLFTMQNELRQAFDSYNTEKAQVQLFDKIYRDELSRYKNGKVNYVALLETRNDLVNAQLDTALALFNAWSVHAALLRASSTSFNY